MRTLILVLAMMASYSASAERSNPYIPDAPPDLPALKPLPGAKPFGALPQLDLPRASDLLKNDAVNSVKLIGTKGSHALLRNGNQAMIVIDGRNVRFGSETFRIRFVGADDPMNTRVQILRDSTVLTELEMETQ